jgi:chemotaxis protein methyltransferase CheR
MIREAADVVLRIVGAEGVEHQEWIEPALQRLRQHARELDARAVGSGLAAQGLYDRARIYATDINEVVVHRARAGIFPLERMQEYTENYIRAGGTRSFSEYYVAKYDGALFSPSLTRTAVFSQHNLVTDHSFSEFNVIFCRNVLIYFDRELQNRVHELFYESLVMFGILALGSKESLRFSDFEGCYEKLDAREKLYRKVR